MAELFDSKQAPEPAAEPVESAEPTEPTESVESAEPAEPVETTEPTEPETTPEGESGESVTETPKAVEAKEPAKPQPAAVDPMDDWRKRWADVDGRYQSMKAKIGQKKLDPISDSDQYAELMELLEARQNLSIERQEIADSRVAETTAQVERDRYWAPGGAFSQSYPGVNPDEGRKMWESTITEIAEEYRDADPTAIRLAATVAFKAKLMSGSDGKKPAAAVEPRKPSPAITSDGGRVIPKGASTKPPAPKPLSAAEEVLRKFGPPEKVL